MVTKTHARTNPRPVLPSASEAAEEFHLVRPENEVGRFDTRYVLAIVVVRWGILVAYIGLAVSGIVAMNPFALAASAGWIAVTNAAAMWSWNRRTRTPWYDNSYLFLDSLSVTVGVLASANLGYPFWMAYVMVMSSGAAELHTRWSALLNVWCIALYVLCAGVMQAAGWYDVDAGILAVTTTIMAFIGMNLTVTFDGNRRLRAYIRKMSVTDPLTGLANRRRLTDALANPPSTEYSVAVAVLDVDNFKQYNDSYGHLAGDQLLVRLAETLTEEFPAAHIISRYGGDEFVVLYPCTSPGDASERASKLVNGYGFRTARRAGDRVPVSVGVALWPDHQPTLDGALAAADDCLRAAKRTRKGTVVTFAADMPTPRPA